MPRYDQVTRQWLLLQALQKPGGATIEELSPSVPEDFACCARTIRRDLQALAARFPIYTTRVDGQVRWKGGIQPRTCSAILGYGADGAGLHTRPRAIVE